MPLYEYKCDACQKIHELMQKFSDAPLSECPECKGPVDKMISLSSFALKGSGWYTTDYKRSPQKSSDSTTGEPTPTPAPEAVATETTKPSTASSAASPIAATKPPN